MSFLLPLDHEVHALSPDCAFTLPPRDGSLTLPEIFDFHYERNPNHPLFVYANTGGVTNVLYSDVVPALHRAARLIADVAGIDLDADPASFSTIAIMANSGK
jgi:hypothetical protein